MLSGTVRQISLRAMEDVDNHLVVMSLKLANELMFPGEPFHVVRAIAVAAHRGPSCGTATHRRVESSGESRY